MHRSPYEKIVELKMSGVFNISVKWYSQVCQGVATDTKAGAFASVPRRPDAAGEGNEGDAAAERKVRA